LTRRPRWSGSIVSIESASARELAKIISASTHQVRLALDALEQHKGLITHAATAVGRSMGCRQTNRLGLDPDDSRRVPDCTHKLLRLADAQ
jgi:predicted ArsR family transcriptional regulator